MALTKEDRARKQREYYARNRQACLDQKRAKYAADKATRPPKEPRPRVAAEVRQAQKNAANRAWRARNPELAKERKRAWYLANPDKVRDMRRRYEAQSDRTKANQKRRDIKLRAVGWTYELKVACLSYQGGVCAICRKPPTSTRDTCADHCHATTAARGVLCKRCNTSLGYYETHLRAAGVIVPAFDVYLSDPPVTQLRRQQQAA
jgi:hypothetical protein